MSSCKNISRAFIISLILVVVVSFNCQAQQVRINEFMALNNSTIHDEDGDYSDWIELYNYGNKPAFIDGWSLTDDSENIRKWLLPKITLEAGGYLLLFASGKDRVVQASELHANFKLSGSGEYLAFANSEGVIISEFNPGFPEQQSDVSYGYLNDEYVKLSEPTPGTDNKEGKVLVTAPVFDVPHGVFTESFNLRIESSFNGAEIYYTLDGSNPKVDNANLYTTPIQIDSTSIVRAVSVAENNNYSKVLTQTYLFTEDIIRQTNNQKGYPKTWGPYSGMSGTAIADYGMDADLMLDNAFAESVIDGLKSLPVISLVSDIDNFFSHSTNPDSGGIYIYTGAPVGSGIGKGWERPASMEYIPQDGTGSIQVNCGMRLHGGHSRLPEKSPKHSFRLAFRNEYGPTKLRYPLFNDDDATTTFNSLVLRAGFGLSWIHHSHGERKQAQYQRDIWIKDTQREIGHVSSHSSYVHLFINGLYWGVYAPSERMDSDFAASYLEGGPDDFDVIKDYQDVADGNIENWNMLMSLVNSGVTDDKDYQRIQGNNPDGSYNPEYRNLVDVVNLADYMLLNFYGGNTDWDHHNWAAAKNRNNPLQGFNFFCWDAEHILKSVKQNVLNENNDQCPSRIFQQLRKNENFVRLFSDRVQRHCFNGGVLTPESALQRWNNRTSEVEKALTAESARWGDYRRDVHPFQTSGPFDLYTYDEHWLAQRNFMVNTYFPQRTQVLLDQLRSAGLFPAIDAPGFLINDEPFPVENVSRGDVLSMTSEEGVIYYTTNGQDPAIWEQQANRNENKLIGFDTKKYVIVPTGVINDEWRSDKRYDHTNWKTCSGEPGGVGYDTKNGYEKWIGLDVASEMRNGENNPNTSCYVRIPFVVNSDDAENIHALYLNVLFDDGFAIFLNGTRVAESNVPSVLKWNSASDEANETTGPVQFNISEYVHLLEKGENLLAVQAMNTNIYSSDFLFNVELVASDQVSSSVANNAKMYSGPIELAKSTCIKARTYNNGSWSALMNSTFVFEDDYENIKITEIHYNPLYEGGIDNKDLEFIELKNTSSSALDLSKIRFSDGIEYVFPAEMILPADSFIVLSSNWEPFYKRYGFLPDGEYNGYLNNGGEQLILAHSSGDTITSVTYDNDSPWPVEADGEGHSLVPENIKPIGNQNGYHNWRISYHLGGSPGEDDIGSKNEIADYSNNNQFKLSQNYPNPFTDITYINYELAENAWVNISVYNLMGQNIDVLFSGYQKEGSYVVSWQAPDSYGSHWGTGVYIYRMTIKTDFKQQVYTRKMIKR